MMFLVITTVRLRAGAVDECLALFQKSNPDLVADQADWIGAEFTADRDANTITVIARWRSAESYRKFAASESFRQTMATFAPLFEGPPEVRVVERLWQMGAIR